MYEISDKYHRRLHHIRPRFKGDLENVLFFMANEIANLLPMEKKEFDAKLNHAIRRFPGNQTKTDKTINNWRTEISSLFGFIVYEQKQDEVIGRPSKIAIRVASKQDLVEFFRFFLYTFQYPGGHLKPYECRELVADEIKFKPAPYILNVLCTAGEKTGPSFGINKAEAAHCIFNDLRVTRDGRPAEEVVRLIKENRRKNVGYNWEGDVIRYAGDILDYMVTADLLVKRGEMYYLNKAAIEVIQTFIRVEAWFDGYDQLSSAAKLSKFREVEENWFRYLEEKVEEITFGADLLRMLDADKESYLHLTKLEELEGTPLEGLRERVKSAKEIGTKEIGDAGEAIIHGHECAKLKKAHMGRLVNKVVSIPDYLGVGYDIRSFDEKGRLKKIEVKTTISNSEIHFNTFYLTANEWNVADDEKESYFVYRLMVSRQGAKLWVIKDPIGEYKRGSFVARLLSGGGAQIRFEEDVGKQEELLIWED